MSKGMDKLAAQYSPEELKKLMIRMFVSGEYSEGMTIDDILSLHNHNTRDKEMRDYVLQLLRKRDRNIHLKKAQRVA